MIKILIVEDEKPIRDLIDLHLTAAGYHCTCVDDGEKASDLLEGLTPTAGRFDLILLDVMLPGVNGYELMEYIRPLNIPVIFVTARHTVKDKVKGLKLGADDYLVKPFDIVELQARVETVLRRFNKTEKKARIRDITVDFEARTVTKNGRNIDLTMKEFDLLVLFIKNKNIALFRETLYEKVWESEFDGSRTVDLHVQRLRRKLGFENYIVAVQKVGYRLEVPQ